MFVSFLVDKCLHTTSFEKRSVAFHVIVLMLSVVPANAMHEVLTKPVIRSLVVTRQNKKHTLHELTGSIIAAIVQSAAQNDACKLAIATLLVQHGGAEFDKLTSTSAVADLLANMDSQLVMQHIGVLCQSLVKTEGDNVEENDEESVSTSAISALYSLTKNQALQRRGDVIAIVLLVLVRLACFQSGEVNAPVIAESVALKKTPKKSKKADTSKNLEVSVFANLNISTDVLNQVWSILSTIGAGSLSAEIQSAAAGRLLALLTDVGNMSVDTLNGSSANATVNLLQLALAMATHCRNSGLELSINSEDEVTHAEAIKKINTLVHHLVACGESKMSSPARVLAVQALFHSLCSDDVAPSLVAGLCDCITVLVAEAAVTEDEDAPELTLFDISMELLALSEKGLSIKGLRDGVKRMWSAYFSSREVSEELVEVIMQAVVGEDSFEDEKNDEDGNDAEEMDEDVEEEDNEEMDVETPAEIEVEEEDESDEEVIAMDDLLDMMSEDDDKDDEATEAALANMLNTRKASRKAGLREAKRLEYVIRSRAIDIFETLLQRCTDGQLLFPLFVPLLACLKTVASSKICQELQEGRTYEQRLRSVIENKLSKIKLHLTLDTENENEAMEVILETLQQLMACLRSNSAVLRQTASAALVCVTRCLLATSHSSAITALSTLYTEVTFEVFMKKNTRLTIKPVDELFTRHVDYGVTTLLHLLKDAVAQAPSEFLRAEACRLLSAAIKHYKSLSAPAQQLLVKEAPSVIDAVVSALSVKELRAKRMKPLLACLLELLQLLQSTSSGINETTVTAISAVMNSDSAKSETVKKQSQQVLDVVSKLPRQEVQKKDKKVVQKEAGLGKSSKTKKAKK